MLCIPVSLKASGIAEMIREIPADCKPDLSAFPGCKLTAAAQGRVSPVFLSVFIRKNSFYLTNARNDKLPFHFRLRQQLFVKVVHSFIRMSDACDLQKLFKNRIQLLLIHQGNFFFRQLSQTYLKKINTELNSIINYAKRFYDLNTNPCGKAGTIGKAKAEEMDYWTYDEYIAFREGVKDKSLSYICFEVLYWTGIREGELLALSPADIDLDNKTISINRTYQRIEGKDVFTSPKTRKSKRKIPIPDFLCQELSDYIQSRYMLDADERLFPVTKSYLSHEMIRGCKNTGVKKIRIHDIRHSHASLLINQGCDALMLADRLGHEKVSTTLNTYSHLFPHKQQELVHSLESLQATDSPTPEPPSDNPLLEAVGITCEVPQTQDNGSDVTIRPQFGPALVPPNTASGKIIQMPQRKII